jgi:hypothetical protein
MKHKDPDVPSVATLDPLPEAPPFPRLEVPQDFVKEWLIIDVISRILLRPAAGAYGFPEARITHRGQADKVEQNCAVLLVGKGAGGHDALERVGELGLEAGHRLFERVRVHALDVDGVEVTLRSDVVDAGLVEQLAIVRFPRPSTSTRGWRNDVARGCATPERRCSSITI